MSLPDDKQQNIQMPLDFSALTGAARGVAEEETESSGATGPKPPVPRWPRPSPQLGPSACRVPSWQGRATPAFGHAARSAVEASRTPDAVEAHRAGKFGLQAARYGLG